MAMGSFSSGYAGLTSTICHRKSCPAKISCSDTYTLPSTSLTGKTLLSFCFFSVRYYQQKHRKRSNFFCLIRCLKRQKCI
uniref:Uncharacterized protein n=1 Tax=Hyaloperonospora arabidopsidis (strain Emoy2) TaxID=559515 RepID=M4B2N7_HYAAE